MAYWNQQIPDPQNPNDQAFLDAVLGLPPEDQAPEYQPQQFQGGNRFLEAFSGAQPQLPYAPQGFGQGFAQALLGSLSSSGQRIQGERQKFDSLQEQRRKEVDAERRQSKLKREEQRFQLTRDAANRAAKPNTPEATEVIQGPNGPVIVRRSEAYGKSPYVKPERTPSEPLYKVVGADGKVRYVTRSQAAGSEAPTEGQIVKPSTGEQKQSLAFYNRGKEALDILGQADHTGKTLEDRIASVNPALGAYGQRTLNVLKGSDRQKYEQAQRAFTQAKLRKESGAAISAAEYESDAKTYFAQPGDTPDVIANKKAAREGVLGGLKFQAGPAYNEFYGDPGTATATPPTPAASGPPGTKRASVYKPGGFFDKNRPKGGR